MSIALFRLFILPIVLMVNFFDAFTNGDLIINAKNRVSQFSIRWFYFIFSLIIGCFQGGELLTEVLSSNVTEEIVSFEMRKTDGTLITHWTDFKNVRIKLTFETIQFLVPVATSLDNNFYFRNIHQLFVRLAMR
jgi:hypothetical protein